MQARLEFRQFPVTVALLIVIAVTALVLGAAMGYAVKPITTTSGPARVIVVSSQPSGSDPAANNCYLERHNLC